MTWRKELRRATFRGLEFDAVDLSRAEGKRATVHEFPHQRRHIVEEMGPKSRAFTVRAFIAGSDYQDRRDNLSYLLAEEGPAELITPWRSPLMVVALDWTITDSAESGGACTIDISFVEDDALDQPLVVTIDARSEAQIAADEAVDASAPQAADVNAALSPGALPPIYRASLTSALIDLDAGWRDVLGVEPGWLFAAQGGYDLDRASAALADLPRARPIVRAVMAPPPASSPSVGGRYDSAAALAFAAAVRAARVAMLARAAVIVVDTTFATSREAQEILAMFADAFEIVRVDAPDSVDDALAELQGVVTDILSDAANTSPRIATITVASPTPALVIAWQLYADTSRESEVIALNSIANPATLYGDYEVLT